MASLRRGREPETVPCQGGGKLPRRAAPSLAQGGAGHRQDAVQLPLGRADSPGIPEYRHHPLPPRRRRRRVVTPHWKNKDESTKQTLLSVKLRASQFLEIPCNTNFIRAS